MARSITKEVALLEYAQELQAEGHQMTVVLPGWTLEGVDGIDASDECDEVWFCFRGTEEVAQVTAIVAASVIAIKQKGPVTITHFHSADESHDGE